MKKLNGLKTYLFAAVFFAVNAAASTGVISAGEQAATIGAANTISDCVTQSINSAQLIAGTAASIGMAIMRLVTQMTTFKNL